MDPLVSQHQLLYRDQSRPSSSASTSSNHLDHQLSYPSSSQTSLLFQQNYHQQQPHHYQQQPRKNSPTSSLLQISTANSSTEDQDADEQTAHPSRMQPQLPAPQHQQQIPKNSMSDSSSIKSSVIPGLTRPLNHREQELLAHLDRLKFFLATAPSRWNSEDAESSDSSAIPIGHPSSAHPALNRFFLPNSEYVSCVLWGGLYHITGTDIVRALVFRFEAFGRPVRNMKKFEEGVFSDLRNLKPGTDACLEEPKSPFLDLLFKYQCIRTQKKQKVFYWFSVPHDRLFLDALERDLKREKMGMEPTTVITGEPALSFTYDPKRSLYEQFCKAQGGYEGEGELEAAVRRAEEISGEGDDDKSSDNASSTDETYLKKPTVLDNPNTPFASMFSLFEGSPTYKQRRKKTTKKGSTDSTGRSSSMDEGSGHYLTTGLVRDTNRMTAADLFMAQARGELASIGLNERSTHPRSVSMHAVQHSQNFHTRGRLESRNTYPTQPPQVYTAHHNSHRPQLLHGHAATLPGDWSYLDPSQNPDPLVMSDGTLGRSKAFVCPLFSCGRMFKRMEHLKRHLRTHTMERPYQCQRCSKKFSRSDNLNQHIRIHLRMDAESGSGAAGFMNEIVDESLFDDGVNADIEDTEEMDGDDAPFITDVRLCEVEVAGSIHDVPGDEEGLVTTDPAAYVPEEVGIARQQDGYYSEAANGNNASQHPLSTSPEPAIYSSDNSPGVQWMGRSAPSPAFSSVSMPSPQSRMSSAAPMASYNTMGEYVSVSAPSHKATFDHGSMYPAHVHTLSGGPGPVRRHRSVTPSVARYGESIRRPYSAAMSDIPPPNTRSYHPYAAAANSHSSSAQSSPGSYHAPLDYGSTMSGQMPVTIARSGSDHGSRPGSSHLQDHMNRMLSLDSIDAENIGYASESVGNGYSGGMYRTDSPGTYAHANYMVNTNENQVNHPSVVDGHSMYAMHSQAQYGAGHAFYGQPQSVPM